MAKLLLILIFGGALAGALKPSDPPLLIDSAPYQSVPLDAQQ